MAVPRWKAISRSHPHVTSSAFPNALMSLIINKYGEQEFIALQYGTSASYLNAIFHKVGFVQLWTWTNAQLSDVIWDV